MRVQPGRFSSQMLVIFASSCTKNDLRMKRMNHHIYLVAQRAVWSLIAEWITKKNIGKSIKTCVKLYRASIAEKERRASSPRPILPTTVESSGKCYAIPRWLTLRKLWKWVAYLSQCSNSGFISGHSLMIVVKIRPCSKTSGLDKNVNKYDVSLSYSLRIDMVYALVHLLYSLIPSISFMVSLLPLL